MAVALVVCAELRRSVVPQLNLLLQLGPARERRRKVKLYVVRRELRRLVPPIRLLWRPPLLLLLRRRPAVAFSLSVGSAFVASADGPVP